MNGWPLHIIRITIIVVVVMGVFTAHGASSVEITPSIARPAVASGDRGTGEGASSVACVYARLRLVSMQEE